MVLFHQREKFNHDMGSLNQKVHSADQYSQKMENLAADLQSKRNTEKKRLENLKNYQMQKLNLEKQLEELTAQGMLT